MVKVLGLNGEIQTYYGEQCGRFCVESDGYGIPFKVIEFGDYGLDSLLIPVSSEKEADEISMSKDLDFTNIPVYVSRCETYYNKDFQEIIDEWYLVDESDFTPENVLELAKSHMPNHIEQRYSRVVLEKENDKHFKITFYPLMSEYAMRKQLKEMGYILKRHKDIYGVNMYMILKADNNSVYAGENFTMTEVDVDRFINE